MTAPIDGAALLDDVAAHFRKYICTTSDADHDLLALWAVHTHVAVERYTTPRLQLDSPMPGAGKTTVLEHLARLALSPVMAASLSSPALLTRMLDNGPRSILIDEADRSLNPDKEGVGDLYAVLNSGYKRGATRPVLVPVKGGGWEAKEMPTFAPVAIAGNNPSLPDDTRSRIIRVLLLPDMHGQAKESDWELIEDDVAALAARIRTWADQVRDRVKACRPDLPAGITGRLRECWSPLRRVAEMAGERWPATVDTMSLEDLEQRAADREDGMVKDRPAVVLLRDIIKVWPAGTSFMKTTAMAAELATTYPESWGIESPFGKPLTVQRLGRMLAQGFKVHTAQQNSSDKNSPRGYHLGAVDRVLRRMKLGSLPQTSGSSGTLGTSGEPPALPEAPNPPEVPEVSQGGIGDEAPDDIRTLGRNGTHSPGDTPGVCPICQVRTRMAPVPTADGLACRKCAPGIRAGTRCADCGHPRDLTRDGRCDPCNGRAIRSGAA